MKNQCLKFLFCSCLSFGAQAYNTTTNVSVLIVPDTESSTIRIEAMQDQFITLYRKEKNKFDDIKIHFRVVSPLSVTKGYKLTLLEKMNQCDGMDINVETKFDNTVIEKGDEVSGLNFDSSDANEQWKFHKIDLEFPEILQTDKQQICDGLIGIQVSLDI
ncbi:hypothetical protein V4T45_003993 [Vibrio vulnificus]|nr:hypothetical protein [Vibrio vulnificus]ELR8772624.1 hypothetical protein [Vibrio vulnificus]